MSRLDWGGFDPQYYQGLDRGVVYLPDEAIAWNGLVSMVETTTENLNVEHYFDGVRTHISKEMGEFEASAKVYTYPPFFDEEPRPFGMSYRVENNHGHQIHLLYNVMAFSESISWLTNTASVNPHLFGFRIIGIPKAHLSYSPTIHLTLEAGEDKYVTDQVEALLYGDANNDARLPGPAELVELYSTMLTLKITYHNNGTYTAEGPDDVVRVLSDGRFELNTPTATPLDAGRFRVSSY